MPGLDLGLEQGVAGALQLPDVEEVELQGLREQHPWQLAYLHASSPFLCH